MEMAPDFSDSAFHEVIHSWPRTRLVYVSILTVTTLQQLEQLQLWPTRMLAGAFCAARLSNGVARERDKENRVAEARESPWEREVVPKTIMRPPSEEGRNYWADDRPKGFGCSPSETAGWSLT